VTDSPPASTTRPRPIWPLYLAAGLSFIPVLGFFWGSVAVTWGLVSSRPGAMRAVIIAATGALLNIVGMFVLVAVFSGRPEMQAANLEKARLDMEGIVVALEEFHEKEHSYPVSLPVLQAERGMLRPIQIFDLGPGILRLRVPQSFHYVVAPDGLSYDLFSVGPDGKPGTADDLRPLVPDSLRGRTGLRPPP
jgi:hypothetical protein